MGCPSILNLARLTLKYPYHSGHQFIKKIKFRNRHNWIKNNAFNSEKLVPLPLAYGIELTSKCNLRCSMCYAWGEKGWYKELEQEGYQGQELDWNLLQKIIKETYYTLWGGEPLLYSHFKDLIKMLARLKCFCYVCTNATLLADYIEDIWKTRYITLIVSVDGLEDQNDRIRGTGSFKKIMQNVKLLKSHPFKSPYIGAELTVLPHNVHILDEFCYEMSKFGFDWVLLNLCWFISTQQKQEYEKYMKDNFGVTAKKHLAYHNPDFDLDRNVFIKQFRKIEGKKFPIPVLWTPPIKVAEDINKFIDTPQEFLTPSFCNKQWIQADINKDAEVVTCKDWADYKVGDLKVQTMSEIWNSKEYKRFRETICKKGLLPICSKCYALALYRDKRKSQ